MSRPARVSPDRILAAAASEFAERGFAGARVDGIARRAHVNKAMLYYHFGSKQKLYRALLRRTFAMAAERLDRIAVGPGSPSEKLERVVAGIAEMIGEHAFFPSIMMREIAEGGAHLDRDTLRALVSVPRVFVGIVEEGIASGAFRPVHPILAYFTVLAPIVFFLAAGPIRREITARHLMNMNALAPDEFVIQMQGLVHRALAADAPGDARPTL